MRNELIDKELLEILRELMEGIQQEVCQSVKKLMFYEAKELHKKHAMKGNEKVVFATARTAIRTIETEIQKVNNFMIGVH